MKREKRWLLPVCVLAVLCIAFLYLWVNRDAIGGRSLLENRRRRLPCRRETRIYSIRYVENEVFEKG